MKKKRTHQTTLIHRRKENGRTARTRKKSGVGSMPGIAELEAELKRERYKNRYKSTLRSTVYTLLIVAAVAVLVATLWMPVLQIYGNSMTPTLDAGDIVLSWKTDSFETGQIIAFYYNNKILIKRVIAGPGDWVNIDEDGTVYINGTMLEEAYLAERALGDCNIELPYQVPDEKVFVMGDHRSTSVDSRNSAVGCIALEQVVGKIVFRVWPLKQLGMVK